MYLLWLEDLVTCTIVEEICKWTFSFLIPFGFKDVKKWVWGPGKQYYDPAKEDKTNILNGTGININIHFLGAEWWCGG